MKTNTRLLSTLFIACFCVAIFTQCGEAKKKGTDVTNKIEEGAEKMTDEAKKLAEEGKKAVDDMADKGSDAMDKMDSKAGSLNFESGSWGANVLAGIGSGTTVFTLDQVPYGEDNDDEEILSDAASKQLDNLAEILKSDTSLKAEVQGHNQTADTKVGQLAKDKVSKVKANINKRRLISRGVSKDQITHEGYGNTQLLPGIEATDKAHRRITVSISK